MTVLYKQQVISQDPKKGIKKSKRKNKKKEKRREKEEEEYPLDELDTMKRKMYLKIIIF